MIDYEKRATYLLGRFQFFHDQAKWERDNRVSLVNLAPAIEQLLLNIDGEDSEDIKRRVYVTDLLVLARNVLSIERRKDRLHVKNLINEFLSGAPIPEKLELRV